MSASHPYTINKAYEKTMPEVFFITLLGNNVRADNKNSYQKINSILIGIMLNEIYAIPKPNKDNKKTSFHFICEYF